MDQLSATIVSPAGGDKVEGDSDTIVTERGRPQDKKSLNRATLVTGHQFRLGLSDLASVVWAVAGAQLIRFGIDATSVDVGESQVPYAVLSLVLAAAWWLALLLSGTRDPRILGYGPEEYKRVTSASLWLFGGIAVISYVFRLDPARGYVAVALPLGITALLFSRWILRNVLVHERNAGFRLRRVLLVGAPQTVAHLNRQLSAHPEAGYRPVALYVTSGHELPDIQTVSVPVAGTKPDLGSILAAVETSGADTVVVSSGAALAPTTLRELGWALSAREVSLVMAPALTDVAGPRIRTTPVAGLPLIHVTTPRLDGFKGITKRGFDMASALALLILLGIPMVAIALWVKFDSPGPVIFRQSRIGRAGEPFDILKFRSMVPDAESRLASLHHQNQGSGLLFKMKEDPRVTRSGRFLRRYSLDELPQLFNVLNGSMSLVGPRPPLPREVEQYDQFAHRRLLIKPGITGLWQVSGRSNLSWDDSIRLDLYYVENWSLIQDLIILLRTVKAVVGKTGAY